MEDPASHTPAMRVIDDAIEQHQQAMAMQVPGGSLTLVIYQALVNAGYLKGDE